MGEIFTILEIIMLSNTELTEYFEKHQLSDAAREYITLVRNSDPSRLVGERTISNVCTLYPSRKMGCSIQAESRTAEYAYLIELEYDNEIIEYWDQPEPVSVIRTNKNLVKRRGSYTPDFLLLTTKGPKIVEVKKKDAIEKLLKEKPHDWIGALDNVCYMPAKIAFTKIGINFEVFSSEKLNPVRTSNLKLLLQAMSSGIAVEDSVIDSINKCLMNESWVRLSELIDKCDLKDVTPVLQMIRQKKLFCMLNDEFLSKPESVWVSRYERILRILYEESSDKNKKNSIEMYNGDVDVKFIPSEKQAIKALESIDRIESGEKSRSVSRYIKLTEDGKKKGLTMFQSLIPRTNLSGNKTERINKVCKDYLLEFIKTEFKKEIGYVASYDLYKNKAKKQHPAHAEVSLKTFRKYIDLSDQEKIAFDEGGERKKNAVANPSNVKDREMKPMLPFEEGTIDHALAKIKLPLTNQNGVKYTARPWVTMLIDIYTGMILSVWASFKAPSKFSCAIAIRNCVRTHGRIPASIVIDRGSDFQSVYFSSMLINYEVSPKSRPVSHSRFGGEVERMIGDFKTQWLVKRPGGFSSVPISRAVSSSHSSDSKAEMEIDFFWKELLQYVEWRNSSIIGNSYESPNILFDRESKLFSCVGKKISYENEFVISTAIDARKYTVDPVRGIHVNEMHYWHSDLKETANLRKKVEVRIEPENPYRVYARVNNKWVTCFNTGEQSFNQLDPVSRMAMSMRKLEGRTIRDKAEGDAHQNLIEQLLVNDKVLEEIRSSGDLNSDPELEVCKSLSSKIHTMKKEKLTVSSWED